MNYFDMMREALTGSAYIQVNKDLIQSLGLCEATLYTELLWRANYYAKEMKDGELWFYASNDDLCKSIGISAYLLRQTIDSLKEQEIIDIKNFGMPARRHFKIIENNKILQLLGQETKEKLLAESNDKQEEKETQDNKKDGSDSDIIIDKQKEEYMENNNKQDGGKTGVSNLTTHGVSNLTTHGVSNLTTHEVTNLTTHGVSNLTTHEVTNLIPHYNKINNKNKQIKNIYNNKTNNQNHVKAKQTKKTGKQENELQERLGKLNSDLREMVEHFFTERKERKAPMTDYAKKLFLNKLEKDFETDEERIEAIETAIVNRWKSVYPKVQNVKKKIVRDCTRRKDEKLHERDDLHFALDDDEEE